MMNLYEAIGCRHSVRKYTDREVTEKLRGQILSYFDKTSRLNDRIRVEAVIFDNTKKKPMSTDSGRWMLPTIWRSIRTRRKAASAMPVI